MENKGNFFLPGQGSTVAPDVDALFLFIGLASLIIFAIVVFGLIYFGFKYRARSKDVVLTPDISHNTTLELIWTIIPTILVLIVFVWGFKTFLTLNVVPKDAIEIKVTGKKWFWTFDYPDGYTSVNEIVVPVNTPIKLLMSSEDVIHSFYVPNFRVKMDVVPNRYSVTWFEAVEPGDYNLFCTEYCGTGHSEMIGNVKVLAKNDFATWQSQVGNDADSDMPLEELGEKIYKEKACFTCHTLDGSRLVGPSLKGTFGKTEKLTDGTEVLVDENYLRRSLLDPGAQVVESYPPVMPTYQGLLSDRDLDGIIAYIKTLKQ